MCTFKQFILFLVCPEWGLGIFVIAGRVTAWSRTLLWLLIFRASRLIGLKMILEFMPYYILQQYLKPTLICNAYSSYYFLKGILIAIDTKLGVRSDTHNKRVYFFYKYSFVRNCKKNMGFRN